MYPSGYVNSLMNVYWTVNILVHCNCHVFHFIRFTCAKYLFCQNIMSCVDY